MKKGLILYRSKYGATKKYAGWLAEATRFDCLETKKADARLVKEYEVIVLGGGIYASGIAGISFLKKNPDILRDKKVAVFCVGASPYEEKAFREIRKRNFTDTLEGIPCFYFRGAWRESGMSWMDRTLCGLLKKEVAGKDPSKREPWETALMSAAGKDCDWTDRAYMEPLLDYLEFMRE